MNLIIQFYIKDPIQESMKIGLDKLPKLDVRNKAYVGIITAVFANHICKIFRNIHCNRPIPPNNSPFVRMGNPPAGSIVTN